MVCKLLKGICFLPQLASAGRQTGVRSGERIHQRPVIASSGRRSLAGLLSTGRAALGTLGAAIIPGFKSGLQLPYLIALPKLMIHNSLILSKWARWGSNPRPRDYESPALTAELQARFLLYHCFIGFSQPCRFEPVPESRPNRNCAVRAIAAGCCPNGQALTSPLTAVPPLSPARPPHPRVH